MKNIRLCVKIGIFTVKFEFLQGTVYNVLLLKIREPSNF